MAIVEYLIADVYGAKLGKHSERLRLTKDKQILIEAPLTFLKGVIIAKEGISLSSDVIIACAKHNIPISFMEGYEIAATLYSAYLVGTIETRREQLRAYDDERGFRLAQAFTSGKLVNQALTLRYWARNRQDDHPTTAEALRQTALELEALAQQVADHPPMHVDYCRDQLMGYEGYGAALYWQAVGLLIPSDYAWPGRATRGAHDPINSLLNYGYGILYREIERACFHVGLDPFGGYLHADRPGKPSLTLDLIEEFRQLVVDRVVVGLAARRYTIEQMPDGQLGEATRRDYADKIIGQLQAEARYEGERMAVRRIIQRQAQHMTAYVRGETATYTPYRWED